MAISEAKRLQNKRYYERNKERLKQLNGDRVTAEYRAKKGDAEWMAARRAYQRDWYQRNRASELVRAGAQKRGDRRAYMRQWWARTKAANPQRHAHYVTRSNKARAVAGLPPEIHEMRRVLYEFRSLLLRQGVSHG